ncbi:MAG TPA: hypothetical protein VKU87_12000 [Thermomicrobiaceae bacterium]|nr:hypothetical protein [Thermomicrobiaceae bacterium]
MTGAVVLVLATFLASAVEGVEALTIVLAVGVTRGWRSTLKGLGTALVALAIIVAILGPALTHIPINGLRLVIGALLLIFGLQWLRKAVLRASGFKSLHDEDAIYQHQVAAAQSGGTLVKAGMDWYSFTIAFKGVLLEGMEVVFIVLTFGSTQRNIPLAVIGAAAAIILVTIGGVVVHAPLSRVPENTMKFAVGIMLSSFGAFWGAEGAGVKWPGSDAAIFGIIAFILVVSLGFVWVMRQRHEALDQRLAGATQGDD